METDGNPGAGRSLAAQAVRREEDLALRYTLAVLAVVGSLVVMVRPVSAASVSSLVVKDGVTPNVLHDESAEYLAYGTADADGSYLNRVKTGNLEVGDVLRGVINFDSIKNPSSQFLGNSTNDVLQAVFSVKIDAFVDADGGGVANDIRFTYDDHFGDWLKELQLANGQTDSTSSYTVQTGTVARMFTEPTGLGNDFSTIPNTSGSTPDSNVAVGSSGTFFWDMGFGRSSDTWIAFNTGATPPSSSTSPFYANFALSLLTQGAGVSVTPQTAGDLLNSSLLSALGLSSSDLVDFFGSVSLYGPGATGGPTTSFADAGFVATDTTTVQFLSVPLPNSALLGMALLGLLGFAQLRSRRRNASSMR
jgi:hypothetical protein